MIKSSDQGNGGDEHGWTRARGEETRRRLVSSAERLFGEHGVSGPVLSQQGHQELVGGPVTGILQLAADQTALSYLEQPLAGR